MLRRRVQTAIDSGKYWDPVKSLGGIRKKMEYTYADTGGRLQILFLYGYRSAKGKTYLKRFRLGRGGLAMCKNRKFIDAWHEAVKVSVSLENTAPHLPGGVARPEATLHDLVHGVVRSQDRAKECLTILRQNELSVLGMAHFTATEIRNMLKGSVGESSLFLQKAEVLTRVA